MALLPPAVRPFSFLPFIAAAEGVPVELRSLFTVITVDSAGVATPEVTS